MGSDQAGLHSEQHDPSGYHQSVDVHQQRQCRHAEEASQVVRTGKSDEYDQRNRDRRADEEAAIGARRNGSGNHVHEQLRLTVSRWRGHNDAETG